MSKAKQKTSTCPNCSHTAPFGTFCDLGECPECAEPLTTLCRMATEGNDA